MKSYVLKKYPLKKRWPSITLALILLALAGYSYRAEVFSRAENAASPSGNMSEPGLRWSDCWFDIPRSREIHCGIYTTGGETGTFSLPVVVVKDSSSDHREDPLIYLAGGPGDSSQMSADTIEHWFYWLDRAQLSRDFILFDQRGTGLSKPNIDCDAFDRFNREALARDMSLEAEYEQGLAVLRRCLRELARQGFDHTHFSTPIGAADIRGLMQALDYPSWNLLGVSYGTRLALEVAAQQQAGLRSAILDSPYPQGKGALSEWPWLLDHALRRLWRDCAAGESGKVCRSAGIALEDIFWQLLARLRQAPVTLTVKSWFGEAPITVVVNDHRFLSIVFSCLYDAALYPKIADAMLALSRGGTRLLEDLVEPFANYALDREFSNMVFFATECADNARVSAAEYEAERAKYPKLLPYTDFAWRFDFCRYLAAPNVPAERPPQVFDGGPMPPMLILSGQLDPVTPPVWARELASRMESSQIIVFPGIGHSVINSDDCAHGLLRAFLDRPDTEVSTRCLGSG